MPLPDESVLVVRPGALGDTLLTLPLLETLRAKYPRAQIRFLGTGAYRSVVPPGVLFHAVDSPEWLWLFSEAPRKPCPVWGCPTHAYVFLKKPETVIANLRLRGISDIRQCSTEPSPGRHLVEDLHQRAGFPIPARSPALVTHLGGARSDMIWMHPGSGGQRKCMPLPEMALLGGLLKDATGWELVVTAGEADGFLHKSPGWDDLVGQPGTRLLDRVSLTELVSQMRGAGLYVGNDSGISHLAANLGITSLVFYLETDRSCWAPWVPADQVMTLDLCSGQPRFDVQDLARRFLGFSAARMRR